jgi:hypothetical protein
VGSYANSVHVRNLNGIDLSTIVEKKVFEDDYVPTIEEVTPKALLSGDLRGLYVSKAHNGWSNILDSRLQGSITLATELSKELNTYAIFVMVNDSDSWFYQLYHHGLQIDEFDSSAVENNLELCADHLHHLRPLLMADIDDNRVIKVLQKKTTFAEEVLLDFLPLIGVQPTFAYLGYEYMDGFSTADLLEENIAFTDHLKFRKNGSVRAVEHQDHNCDYMEQLIRDFARTGREATALNEAARFGYFDLLKELLATGMAVDARDEYGGTALALAASGGQLEIVKYLIDLGADVNAVCDRNGMTPLISCLAAFHSKRVYMRICKSLLESGAWRSLGLRDKEGWTALDWAKDGRPVEVVALIEQYIAKLDAGGLDY